MRKKESNEVANALVLIVQIGVTMLVPILLCAIGGAWLDHKLGTRWIGVCSRGDSRFSECLSSGQEISKRHKIPGSIAKRKRRTGKGII